ncbi:hypothetical protein [Ornithinimicrobium panacihumi]|uniref:hypothetical protein n=1 Tax=Ornithinimicrobium panacihumi TaxID=2008449 RepID=UPI003F8C523B
MATLTAPSVRPAARPDRRTQPMRHLTAPLVGTGVLMATYLLLRPYGDHAGGSTAEAAQAFASTRWVVAHLFGALALASFARLALRLDDLGSTRLSRAARWTGLAGAALVLPYYGAETFGLHALGRAALAGDQGVLQLVDDIRDQPVALTMFGLGLVLLAACGLILALAWQRRTGSLAAWPLGALMALFLPQFYLPPTGRMAYGVLYAVAALLLLLTSRSLRTQASAQ